MFKNNLIEKSALAYDQRDEAEQKMTAVGERDHKNIAQYQMEYKVKDLLSNFVILYSLERLTFTRNFQELLRQLDHDTTLKKFLLDKAEERCDIYYYVHY